MDAFPALAPTTRIFSPGDVPNTVQVSLSGSRVAFRRGSRRVDQGLRLTFGYLEESQVELIRDHYFQAKGSYDIFFLPSEIWGDFTALPIPSPSNIAWRYDTSPEVTDSTYDRWSVSVDLVSYVIELGDINIDIPAGDTGSDPGLPTAVDYIYDGLTSSASPARDYIINSGASV